MNHDLFFFVCASLIIVQCFFCSFVYFYVYIYFHLIFSINNHNQLVIHSTYYPLIKEKNRRSRVGRLSCFSFKR